MDRGKRSTGGRAGSASHERIRSRLLRKERKCHRMIESSSRARHTVSRLPLQTSVLRAMREAVRRTSRASDTDRG